MRQHPAERRRLIHLRQTRPIWPRATVTRSDRRATSSRELLPRASFAVVVEQQTQRAENPPLSRFTAACRCNFGRRHQFYSGVVWKSCMPVFETGGDGALPSAGTS